MDRRLLDINELAPRYGFPKWTIRSYCSQGNGLHPLTETRS